MDAVEQVDRDLINRDIEISGPLDVRRLQGNARCLRCRNFDFDCYLERKTEGNFCCLRCSSSTECHFRRVVVKEAPASSFTWEQLLVDDPSIDTTATGAATPISRPRKRPFGAIADTTHPGIRPNNGNQWPESDRGLASTDQSAKGLMVGSRSRDAIEQELKRIFRPLSPEQIQLLMELYERHPPLQNKDLCPINAAFSTKMKQNPSIASEPASQIRTHVSNVPVPNVEPYYSDFNLPDYLPWSLSTPVYVNETGSWSDQFVPNFPLEPDLLGPMYLPGVTSVADRYSSLLNNVDEAMDKFDGTTQHLAPYHASHTPYQASNIPYHQRIPESNSLAPVRTISQKPNTPSVTDYQDVSLPFKCPHCNEVLNTRSEARKHMARHTKPYVCNVSTCLRAMDGFATRNDLDRHIASVHDTNHAFKMYKCAVPGCKDPTKVWSRKDNFKAHLKRMHPEYDPNEYIEKSTAEQEHSSRDRDPDGL